MQSGTTREPALLCAGLLAALARLPVLLFVLLAVLFSVLLAAGLESCRDRLGLGPAPPRPAAPTPLPLVGGLGAAVGAVGRHPLLLLQLLALRRLPPRLDDGVGDRASDELDRA